jgi:high-affinity iron transporter
VSNAFLGNYLIGLREGLEATLVVSILVAFLVRSNRRGLLKHVWAGAGGATAVSVAFGAVLYFVAQDLLDHEKQELFDAITSILAVCFVTWMIFWMRRFARQLSKDLRGKLETAIEMGGTAVVVMAFLAVVREGLETALLFFAAAQGAVTTSGPLLGLLAGVVSAVVLGWLLYAGAVRINLGTFFRWTGVLLILVAAGILKYGVHDLQESGVLTVLTSVPFDFSGVLDPNSWYGAALAGAFNITPAPSLAEIVAWLGYAVPVLLIFLWPAPAAPVAQKPAKTEATTAAR